MKPLPFPQPRARRCPSSARALAMLRLMPIEAACVPRVHVQARQPGGGRRLHDRPTGQALLLYTPRRDRQFQAGHRAGRWYVRPADDAEGRPRSPGFDTAAAAIAAVSAGRWRLNASDTFGNMPARRPPRVIWSASASDSTGGARQPA